MWEAVIQYTYNPVVLSIQIGLCKLCVHNFTMFTQNIKDAF